MSATKKVVSRGFFGCDATDREGYRRYFEEFGRAFADQEFVVDRLVTDGDLLVVHFTSSAVHVGEILCIEPTGTELSWMGVAVDRYDEAGRIAEAWLYPDWLATLGQLGVLPADVAC